MSPELINLMPLEPVTCFFVTIQAFTDCSKWGSRV